MNIEKIADEFIRIQRSRAVLLYLSIAGGGIYGVVMFAAGYIFHG